MELAKSVHGQAVVGRGAMRCPKLGRIDRHDRRVLIDVKGNIGRPPRLVRHSKLNTQGNRNMNWRLWGSLGLCVCNLVGCGGGGGSSGAAMPAADSNAPTFTFNSSDITVIDSKTSVLMVEILGTGSSLLDYAQFTTDIAHRFAGAGSSKSVIANCAYAGKVTLQFDDRDGNGYASAGDVISATLENCGVPALLRSVSGTLQVQIVNASPSVDIGLQAHLVITDPLKIGAWQGPNIGSIQAGTLQGSMDVKWSESSTGSRLEALSSSADDLRFTASFDGVESTNSLRAIDVLRVVRYDSASISGSMAFLYDVGPRGGMLRVSTKQAFQSDINVAPKQFIVEAEAAQGWVMRAERQQAASAGPTLVAHAVTPAGVVRPAASFDWGQMLSPMTDTRLGKRVATFSDQGGGFTVLANWRGLAYQSNIDLVCQQDFIAGVSPKPYHADALFQRPVAPQPSLTEPGALLKLQFGRAIAAGSPDLQFRFADATQVFDASLPIWDVSATVTRNGSAYEIRPAEPLRQGREYYLQSSYDGVTWVGDRIIRDAQNQIVNFGTELFLNVTTDSSMVASAATSDKATVAAGSPARLRGSASLRDGQTVTGYQWEQISGVPLHLSTPLSVDSNAFLDSSNPQPVGDAVLQLTITDSFGSRDRVRVLVKAGSFVLQGAALYTETKDGLLAPQPAMSTGVGSVFYGPSAGTVSPRVPGPTEGGTGVSFSVTPANGQALALGTYANAARSNTPGSQNGLLARVFCNTTGSPVTGSFQVLDLGYAADGTINRLAIDFVQQCQAGAQEYQRGSYRFNSTMALTP